MYRQMEFGCFQFIAVFIHWIIIYPIQIHTSDVPKFNSRHEDLIGDTSMDEIVMEGDILSTPFKGNKLNNKSDLRWPNAKLIYQIDDSFNTSQKSIILSAMEEIWRRSCFQFEERANGETDFVHLIRHKYGCWSELGHIGGRQELNLGNLDCITRGQVLHELMHSLGLQHEHTRRDRNRFIIVVWKNVYDHPEVRKTFERRKTATATERHLPYDYGSIMHYPLTAFAKQMNLTTIIPVRSTAVQFEIGQRKELSEMDVQKIRLLYQLHGSCDVGEGGVTGMAQIGNVEFKCDQKLNWLCRNGKCINSNQRCDGVNDCRDFSDELNCFEDTSTETIGNPPILDSNLGIPNNSEIIKDAIVRPRARFYAEPNFIGKFVDYNPTWQENPKCVELPPGTFDSIQLYNGCIRLLKSVWDKSVAVYHKIDDPIPTPLSNLRTSKTDIPRSYFQGFSSVCPCLEHELDGSQIQLFNISNRVEGGIDGHHIGEKFRKPTIQISDGKPRFVVPDRLTLNEPPFSHRSTVVPNSSIIKLFKTGYKGRVECIHGSISESSLRNPEIPYGTPSPYPHQNVTAEREFYKTLSSNDTHEEDRMGHFLSPSKFNIPGDLPFFQVFPQTEANRRIMEELEDSMVQYVRADLDQKCEHKIYVDYATDFSTKPMGISVAILYEPRNSIHGWVRRSYASNV